MTTPAVPIATGSARIVEGTERCQKCAGEGVVLVEYHRREVELICLRCDGTGSVRSCACGVNHCRQRHG